MSLPDYISIGHAIPPKYSEYPHAIALLPPGVTLEDVGDPGHRFAGIFLVDPDCAGMALNDPAFEHYIATKTPVFVYAARARDLRPFLRRAEAFRRRDVSVEAIP